MTISTSPRRDRLTPSLIVAAITGASLLLAVRSPHEGGYGVCPVLALTGYLCPTCGGLRTVHDLTRLDLGGAWAMNPLLTIALPLVGVVLLGWWWRAWRNLPAIQPPAWSLLAGGVIVLGFGILRNL